MKTSSLRHPRGYVSYLLVLSTGILLTLLLTYVYRSAFHSMEIQQDVQLRSDFISKEDAVLRSLVAIVPNRAIRAMQDGSGSTDAQKTPLLWQTIFSDALDQANARNSISPQVSATLGLGTTYKGNTGDSSLAGVNSIFDPIEGDDSYQVPGVSSSQRYVASGLNHRLGAGFPDPLTTTDPTTQTGDVLYPIISRAKNYGSDADQFSLIPYPRINFGYAKPGDLFLAKRNWWAFSMNIYQNDFGLRVDRERDYVLSIYEIPSQLAISANSFTALGQYSSGAAWQNVTVEGRVFANQARVDGALSLESLASRRSISLSSGSVIGGQSFGSTSPFTPGRREQFEIDNRTTGEFYPVSLPSESGRAAFIPINRGAEFFDGIAQSAENNTLSTTTWNNYSVGALQCAMKLDVIGVTSASNQMPTVLRFTYKRGTADVVKDIPVDLPTWRASAYPFDLEVLPGSRICIIIKPNLFAAFLQRSEILGSNPSINHSIAVNVDYRRANVRRPQPAPCPDTDLGVVITDCENLTTFPRGFSLVTNLRLYIGDDFNITPRADGKFPPASLYAPERRFGKDIDPMRVEFSGQVGSLGQDGQQDPIHPLDMKMGGGTLMDPGSMKVNLTPIKALEDLPPVYMMNWLITVEERRKEFY